MLNHEIQRLLERMNLIGRSLSVIADLTAPEPDLHLVDRNDLSCLLSFLREEHDQVRKGLMIALSTQGPV